MAPVSVCIGQKIGSCAVCDFPILAYGIIPAGEDAGMCRIDHDFMWDNLFFNSNDWFFRVFHDMEGSPWNIH